MDSILIDTILELSGWSFGRKVPITHWRSVLKADGFDIHESAQRFITEFGGLTIDIPSSTGLATCSQEKYFRFILDPAEALTWITPERVVGDYNKRTGDILIPVGCSYQLSSLILMGRSGHVYAAFDNEIIMSAENFASFIYRHITGEWRNPICRY